MQEANSLQKAVIFSDFAGSMLRNTNQNSYLKRVVHLMPYHAIGGVEIAARSLPTGRHDGLVFERQYLVTVPGTTVQSGEHHGPMVSLKHVNPYWSALKRLTSDPPDLLIASLWRSVVVLICFKVLRPRTRVVLFLHNTRDAHIVDKGVTRLAMFLCEAIWADSDVTLKKRVPRRLQRKGRVVSFLLKRRELPIKRGLNPHFAFWGRLHKQKGLNRALTIFSAIAKKRPDARFTIIGPDGGEAERLREQVEKLGLESQVNFRGSLPQSAIKEAVSSASFYLQTSVREGMAISVVEAMQSGLVPIVTPVGEIARYCRNDYNSVIVHEDKLAVDMVLNILSEPNRYDRIASAAASYWVKQPLYRDDFLKAAREALCR